MHHGHGIKERQMVLLQHNSRAKEFKLLRKLNYYLKNSVIMNDTGNTLNYDLIKKQKLPNQTIYQSHQLKVKNKRKRKYKPTELSTIIS